MTKYPPNLYNYIFNNIQTLSYYDYLELIKAHEMNCNARWLKKKFKDSRSIPELKELISEEVQGIIII
jgi:hypothetical protein